MKFKIIFILYIIIWNVIKKYLLNYLNLEDYSINIFKLTTNIVDIVLLLFICTKTNIKIKTKSFSIFILYFLALFNLYYFFNVGGVEVGWFFFRCLSTGVFEELFFRVFIFSLLLEVFPKMKCNLTILLTSLIFGLFHSMNFIVMDYESVLLQIGLSIIIGMFFQQIYLKHENILIVILLHSLINFNGMIKSFFNYEKSFNSTPFILILLALMLFLTFYNSHKSVIKSS